ncbi:MAG: gamma-glutamyl-gamma-aminobutyrate hydrolase family protein [Anaerolineales bacterium]|nr:MAG: gamma-glutamyl-gamma-aminobutyrate hydrolase family protein [Anaerolineales bacterium]
MRPLIGIPCQSDVRSRYRRFSVGQSYCRAVQVAGGTPVMLPLLDDETVLAIYGRLDGLLLAGGGDIAPRYFGEIRSLGLKRVDLPRDRVELLLTRRAVEDGLPLLAICRGIQVLNVALGGTLYQDIGRQLSQALRHDFAPEYPRNYLGHEIGVNHGTRLVEILRADRLSVNSFHHQSLKHVAPGLLVAATAPDGMIEAVEMPQQPFVLGVQWHPEELIEDDLGMRGLFQVFVEEAAGRRR